MYILYLIVSEENFLAHLEKAVVVSKLKNINIFYKHL